jgi:hypothetical protein
VIRRKLGFLRHAAVSPTNIHSKILVGVRYGIDGVLGTQMTGDTLSVAEATRRLSSLTFLKVSPEVQRRTAKGFSQ